MPSVRPFYPIRRAAIPRCRVVWPCRSGVGPSGVDLAWFGLPRGGPLVASAMGLVAPMV